VATEGSRKRVGSRVCALDRVEEAWEETEAELGNVLERRIVAGRRI
jgi:hypothetical protein